MRSYDNWFAETWRFVQPALPPVPASVVEIGCGPLGGFVPRLREAGYDVVGVDPAAPEEPGYERYEFEQYRSPKPVDAIIACTSLHHVHDLDLVLDHVVATLVPGGTAVIIEWAWERFDEPTARWCFSRLPEPATDPAPASHEHHEDHENEGWLPRQRDAFLASGLSWDAYVTGWATEEGLHRSEEIVAALDARFKRVSYADTPYFFPELDHTTTADEQAAIDAGLIRATGIRYLGVARR